MKTNGLRASLKLGRSLLKTVTSTFKPLLSKKEMTKMNMNVANSEPGKSVKPTTYAPGNVNQPQTPEADSESTVT